MENQIQGGEEVLGKIVALGEVVSDIYRGEEISDVELGFVARPGGAQANVAVAACRLGSEAAFVGSVGEDLFGDFILRALESEGVDTSGVGRQSAPTRTSLAFVEIGTDGDREFTFYRSSPAADELLSPEDVTEDLLSGASFVKFGDDELSPLLGTDSVEEAAGMLLDRGASLVLISKGPEGAFYATNDFSG